MKKLLLLTLFFYFLLLNFEFANAQVPTYVPTNGLVGYWPFNGNANDASGNGNNGTVNGATLTADRNGNASKAYSFNGTSNYISTSPVGLPIGNQARTVSSWFNTTAGAISTNSYPNVQMVNGYGSSSSGLVIFPQNIVAPQGQAWFETGSSTNNIYSINSVNDGNWHNFTTTYGGSGTEVKMYIDGVLQGSTTALNLNTVLSNFIIGGCPWSTIFFNGKIDDVAIWNRALSQQEITQLYTGQVTVQVLPSYVPTNGLIGFWPFNGNANDASGNGNNGTVLNGVSLTNDRNGNINSAYSFDGVDDRIFINNSFFNNGWSSFTISGWYYLNNQSNPNNGNSSHCIFNTSPHNGLGYDLNWGSSNKYSIFVGTGVPSTSWNVFFNAKSNQNITLNSWKFITLIKNNNTYYLYVDGILDQTWAATTSVQSYLYKFYFGGADPFNSNEVINGKLDDIAIYNRALSQSEITSLYTSNSCIANITNNDTTICKGSSVTLNVISNTISNVIDTTVIESFSMNMFQPFNHSTPILEAGKNYLLKVSGTVGFAGNIDSQDGAYQYNWFGSPLTPYPFSDSAHVWWFVNGSSQIRPTPNQYNSSHIYYFPFLGNGSPLNLSWSDNPYSDNSGQLNFSLLKINNTSTYLWSTGATTPSITVSPLVTTTYYCTVSDGVNTCRDSVKITVGATAVPTAPLAITGATDVCSYIGADTASVAVNYKCNKISTASSYLWSVPAGVTLLSGQGDTSINVRFSASFVSGAITVKSINVCGASTSARSLTVYKRVAATPALIQKEFSPTSIVAVTNVSGLVSETYRIKKVTYATSYNWSMNRATSATITHINTPGVNDTAVIVTFASCFLKDTLSVKAVTPCSISAAKTAILSANTTPTTVAGIGTAGGDFSVCIGTSKTFNAISSTPTATQAPIAFYRWTKPANAVITSATSDSASITVSFNTGFTGGSLTAKGVTACGVVGTTATSAILQYLPPTPLSISSSTNSYNACINSSVTYTAIVGAATTAQAAAVVFRWTRPNNTSITSASADSSSITVRFNTGYVGGTLSVKGQSRCGTQGGSKSQALTHTGCAVGTKMSVPITTTTANSFEVSLYPNPSAGEFKLLVGVTPTMATNLVGGKTPTKATKATVKVIDLQGRLIKSFECNANQVTALGNELKPGVYMVEVRIGNEVKTLRAVRF